MTNNEAPSEPDRCTRPKNGVIVHKAGSRAGAAPIDSLHAA